MQSAVPELLRGATAPPPSVQGYSRPFPQADAMQSAVPELLRGPTAAKTTTNLRYFFFLLPEDCGGEGGIRTPGAVLAHTCFPSMHLKPLGHLSVQ